MYDVKTSTHNELRDDASEVSRADSFPALGLQVEARLRDFHDYLDELKQAEIDKNNKGEQYSDPEDNNVYASAREPEPEVQVAEGEAQTEQEKQDGALDEKGMQRMREQVRDSVTEALLQRREDESRLKKKRKPQVRRGKKSYYENAIDEEDDVESEKSDRQAQGQVPIAFDTAKIDMLTLAMQVEKNQSLTSLYDLNQVEKERIPADRMGQGRLSDSGGAGTNLYDSQFLNQSDQQNLLQPAFVAKGIELSRVSGDLDFTDDEEDNTRYLEKDPEAKRMAEKIKIENVQAWIKDQTDTMNQRTFNENEIIGNFPRDWSGQIRDRDLTLRKSHFRDRDGNVVNERGYLIDEHTGDIRSRYTFDVVFRSFNLVGAGLNGVELPLPYRFERQNFNPHQCMGNFDYDEKEKPIILKVGHRIDKNFRRVNASGWLIDHEDNIIDNLGQVKFMADQLSQDNKGELPKLFNYEGKEYKIKNIMGIFERDKHSKEIILCHNESGDKFTSCDLKGRKVNSKGYLLDARGNIIDKSSDIIWRSHELMYNEPPKIFPFTEFSLNWIRGTLDRDVTQNPKHDDEYDLEGRRINTMGYLIDAEENVVDALSKNVVFKKDVLEDRYGQEAEIPYIFRSGKLKAPEKDAIERMLEKKHQDAARRGRGGLFDEEDGSDDEDVLQDLRKIDGRQQHYGVMGDGHLAPMLDVEGQEIEDIAYAGDQRLLMLGGADDDDYAGQEYHYGAGGNDEQPFPAQRRKQGKKRKHSGGGRPQSGQASGKYNTNKSKGRRDAGPTGLGGARLPPDNRAHSALRNARELPGQASGNPMLSQSVSGPGSLSGVLQGAAAMNLAQFHGDMGPRTFVKRNQFMTPGDTAGAELDPRGARGQQRDGQGYGRIGSAQGMILDVERDFVSNGDDGSSA